MKLPRRRFLYLAAGAAALPALSRIARAQAYPTRPVRLLVGWPPGGAADVVGRLTGQLLSERLGQQFVIENRPGAGGNLAVEAALKAGPDGYTLLMIGSNNAWNVTLYDNLSFDFVRDIAPVASIVRGVGVLVVHPSVSAKSVRDLIASAKANPGKINMASGGVGSPQHVYGELFKMMAGRRHAACALPRRRTCAYRSFSRAGASHVRHSDYVDRAHQGGRAPPVGSDRRNAGGSLARHSDRGRIRAGLRGGRLARGGCSQDHARRDHRQAQQGDQCGSR